MVNIDICKLTDYNFSFLLVSYLYIGNAIYEYFSEDIQKLYLDWMFAYTNLSMS